MSALRAKPDTRLQAAVRRPDGRRRPAPPLLSILLAGLTAAWSAAVIDEKLHGATLPGPSQLGHVFPYLMPALLFAALLIRRERSSWLDELAWIWTTLVLLAVLLLPKLVAGSLEPWALPVIAVAAVVAQRWPAATLLAILVCSAAEGSFHAFWNFPSEKAIALCLGGLWVASLVGLVLRGSRPLRMSTGLLIFCGYLLITLIMVPLAPDTEVAKLGFKDGAWFMMIVPLVATAGWRLATLDRIVKAIIVVSLAASIYAIYRIIVGPAFQEYLLFATTAFNFVDGKLKPGGSFDNAQDMGTWMGFVVPFLFAMMLARRDAWRIAAGVACGLCTVCAIESQTRITLVGMIAGIVLVLLLFEGSRGFPGLRLSVTVSAAVLGVALVTVGLLVTGNHSTHSYNGLLHPFSDPSYIARKYKWSQALKDLATHPFGYGVGTAGHGELTSQVFFAAGDTSVDNGYLKIALEQGLMIMGIFIVALIGIFVGLVRTALTETARATAGIAIGAAGTLVSFAVIMIAEDPNNDPRSIPAWLIIGMGLAVVMSAHRWRTAGPDG